MNESDGVYPVVRICEKIAMNEKNRKESVPGIRMLGILVIFFLCCIALVPSVAATAGTPTAATSDPWSGTWDTTGSTTIASQTVGVLTLTRSGSSVTGTFSNGDQGKGTISGTVAGNQFAGTWIVRYDTESDTGLFVFKLADDKKSFGGLWVSGSDKANTLSTSTEFWDGVRR